MSDEIRPAVKIDCFDRSCAGQARFDRRVTEKKGRWLIEGHCHECKTDQVAVYEPARGRTTHRAVEIQKEYQGDEELYVWTEWRDRNGERVGYLMDGCFQMDIGPIHLTNEEEIDFWKRVDPEWE